MLTTRSGVGVANHLIGASLIVCIALGLAYVPNSHSSTTDAAQEDLTPTVSELLPLVARATVAPEHLAAAGLSVAQAQAVYTTLKQSLTQRLDEWRSNANSLQQARAQLGSLPDDPANATQRASFESQIQLLTGELSALEDLIKQDVHGAIPASLRARHTTIAQNTPRGLPVQYLVVDRTDEEWSDLRESLRAKGIFDRQGEAVPSGAQSVIQSADNDYRVEQATHGLSANADAIRALLNDVIVELTLQ